jgi:hypothetical protein
MDGIKQAIPGHPAADLLRPQRPSLAAWYAGPLAAGPLARLQLAAAAGLQSRLCKGGSSFRPQLLQLVCRSLAGAYIEPDYRQLRATVHAAHDMALLELVYGQLLISRKLQPATTYLERGFMRAARYLDSSDYLRLLRRHELLGYLVLGDTPADPQPLDALLSEAAVIRRLCEHTGRRNQDTHHARSDKKIAATEGTEGTEKTNILYLVFPLIPVAKGFAAVA